MSCQKPDIRPEYASLGSSSSSTSTEVERPGKDSPKEAKAPSVLKLLGGMGLMIPILITAEIVVGGIVSKSIDWVSAGRDLGVAHFTLFWMAVAALAKLVLTVLPLQRKPNWEYQAYVVGLIHNCFCVYYGLFQIDWYGRIPSGFNDLTTGAQQHMFRVLSGYFAFDALYLFVVEIIFQRTPFYKSSWVHYTLHHPICAFGFRYMSNAANCGLMFGFVMPYLEWSGACFNTTWILRYHGINKTHPAFDVSLKAIGALLFTIGRMGVFNYTFYHFFVSEHIDYRFRLFGITVPLLSLYWQYKMVLFFMKAVSPKKQIAVQKQE